MRGRYKRWTRFRNEGYGDWKQKKTWKQIGYGSFRIEYKNFNGETRVKFRGIFRT